MTIQRLEEVPAICENEECENVGVWEVVDVEDVQDDEEGGFVLCPECKQKIRIP